MKKISVVLLMFLIVLSSFSLVAVAEDEINDTENLDTSEDTDIEDNEDTENNSDEELEDEVVDEETAEEIEVMIGSSLGAQVRVLQLQRAVTKSYIVGSYVVELLADHDDVDELVAILAEIKVLKEEVENLDTDSERAVEDFVNIKKDIIDLISDFRKIASPLLSAEQKQEVHDFIKNNEDLSALNQEIRDKIKELNEQRIEDKLKKMSLEDKELLEKVRKNEISSDSGK